MRKFIFILLVLTACAESDDTKKQRFLLKGNVALEKRNNEQAIQYFKEALKIDPCFASALNNIGTSLYRQKQYAEALEYYNQAVACNPKFMDGYFNRSNTLYELNRLPDALRDVEKVLSVLPDTLPALFLSGLIHTKTSEFDKAQVSFSKYLVKDSLNSEVLVNMGTLGYYQKDYVQARNFFKKAIAINQTEANAYNAWALVEAADSNLSKALELVNKALELESRDAFYRNNRGYIYLLQKKMDLALEDINFSIAADPLNAWAYRNKGIYYLQIGEPKNALRLLKQSLEMDPFIESGYYYLMQAYQQVDDSENACKSFKEAIRLKQVDSDKEVALNCK